MQLAPVGRENIILKVPEGFESQHVLGNFIGYIFNLVSFTLTLSNLRSITLPYSMSPPKPPHCLYLYSGFQSFSSSKPRGIPAGESCASSNSDQRAVMNMGVEAVRNPVRLICIFLGSGVCNTVSSKFVGE